MPKRIALRTLTTEAEVEIRRLAKSRKEPMRFVQRARVIEAMLDEPNLSASRAGEKIGFKGAIGIHWVTCFNEKGVAGLMDGERFGRPTTHSEETRSALVKKTSRSIRAVIGINRVDKHCWGAQMWHSQSLARHIRKEEGAFGHSSRAQDMLCHVIFRALP